MRIDRIFWSYTWSIDLYKHNPKFLMGDNTYNVNRFNMPLFQVEGVTGLHTNFPIAFALVSGEKEESFRWVLGALQNLGQRYGIPPPKVFITDYDQAFKNALKAVFPRI